MKQYFHLVNALWMVPIRIFLGYSWFMEGVVKIRGDWLNTVMLAGKATEADTSASITDAGARVYRIINENSPQWYASIADKVLIPNALFFQSILVYTEILIGIMLIIGALTFISGLVSLSLVFYCLFSTGIYETTWWYIPASICMLGGAGKALGLDYFVIPPLKRLLGASIIKNKLK